jgi:phospholipid N-methyltransferase
MCRLFDMSAGSERARGTLEIGCGTGQLTRSLLARGLRVTALEHPVAIPVTCHLACLVDERIGVGGEIAVVLDRNLVEDLAVAPCERPVGHV